MSSFYVLRLLSAVTACAVYKLVLLEKYKSAFASNANKRVINITFLNTFHEAFNSGYELNFNSPRVSAGGEDAHEMSFQPRTNTLHFSLP